MSVRFPPQPVYPLAYDSDYTLFKVYNTSESVTVADNQPWSEEIQIRAVPAGEAEIWGDNGFATIDGELFYYDSVHKDSNGKVCELRNCARNIGGVQTKYNPAHTWVRGVVVADVHNQVALGIMIIEHVVMELDDALSVLEDLQDIQDDCCVHPTLSFRQQASNDTTSTSYDYKVSIAGDYSQVSLDFGDGNSTKDLSGTYTYCGNQSPPEDVGSTIHPVLTVQSKDCTLAMTPTRGHGRIRRHRIPSVPTIPMTEIFIPDVLIPEYPVIDTPLKIPPLEFPFLNTPNMLPPVIFNPDYPIPVEIVNAADIPDSIIVVDNIPSVIRVESDIPSVIKLEATVELICGRNYDQDDELGGRHGGMGFVGEDFLDGFNMEDEFAMDSVGLGIPSEIHIIAPRMPNIKVIHDLPQEIRLNAPHIPTEIHIPELEGKEIPSEIHLRGVDLIPKEIAVVTTSNIPHTIYISGERIPDAIPLTVRGMPDSIRVLGMPESIKVLGIPERIHITTDRIPDTISLKLMNELPTYLFVDGSQIPTEIKVTGFPDSIDVKVIIPELPPLKFEKDKIELVYNGPPLPIQFSIADLVGSAPDDVPRYAIIPMPCK